MTFAAFILIVLSAMCHASWNLLAKKNHMSIPYYTLICSTGAFLWSHSILWTPVQVSALPMAFWGFIVCTVLSDLLYCTGLVASYKRMEMATAYPAMRALPIVLTALLTSLAGWGTPLSWMAKTGFAIVFFGSMLMPLNKFSDFKLSNYLNRNIFFIFLTACGTTGYTVFDSRAQAILTRTNPDVSAITRSITYYTVRDFVLASALWLLVLLYRPCHKELATLWKERNYTPFLAGCFAGVTYILVLLAMTQVNNVSYVQVFRQLGLPIGMAAGVLILKERCTMTKAVGITLILLGLAFSVLRFQSAPPSPPNGRDPSRYRSTTVRGAPEMPARYMIPASVRIFPASADTLLQITRSTSSARSLSATARAEESAQTRCNVRRTDPFSISKIARAPVIPNDGAT